MVTKGISKGITQGVASGAKPGGFSPPQLSNNQLWLTSADASSVGRDVSDNVSGQWLDKSGEGNDTIIQGTGTAQPVFGSVLQNGLPTVTFDGSDFLTLPSGLFPITNGPNTAFYVVQQATVSGNVERIINMSEAGGTRYTLLINASGAVVFASGTTGNNVTKTGLTTTDFNIIRARREGTTLALSFNGGPETTSTNGADEPGVDAAVLGSGAGSQFLVGSIAEVIMYDSSLVTADSSQVESFLSPRWAVPLV